MPPKKATTKETVCWSAAEDACLMRVLRQEKDNGNQSDNGWKSSVWTACEAALANLPDDDMGKGYKTASKCGDHYGNLKADKKDLDVLNSKSGFGYDATRHVVVATAQVWQDLLSVKSNDKYKKWRKKAFPIYEDMRYLLDGIVATSAGAFRAGQEEEEEEDDNEDMREPPTQARAQSTRSQDALGTSDDPADDSDLEISTPAPAPVQTKRKMSTASSSASASASSSSVKPAKRRKRSPKTPDPALSLANSIAAVAGQMQSNSPERRTRAITLVQEDDDMSQNETTNVIAVFATHTSIADAFCAIKDKDARTSFAQKMATRLGFT